MRNKKDYERRKTQRAEQAVEHLKDELSIAKSNISVLECTNKHDSLEVSCLKDSAEKSVLLLARRTDRFVAYRARKEEEIRKLKATAEKKIAALEKQDFGIKTRLLKSLRCLIKVTIKKERG